MVHPTKARRTKPDARPAEPPVPVEGGGRPAEALHTAFRRAGRVMRKVQSGDPALFGVLHHLSCVGPVRLTSLAEQVMLDVSTVSRHVRSLEADGLIARQTDPDDGRAALLVVTPAGTAMLEQTNAQKVRMLETATAGWRDEEIYEFVTMMNRLAEDIGRAYDLETM